MTITNEWISADSWAALAAGGPERGYGMRWGATRAVRVSAADVQRVDVEAAWQRLIEPTDSLAELSSLSRLLPVRRTELVLS